MDITIHMRATNLMLQTQFISDVFHAVRIVRDQDLDAEFFRQLPNPLFQLERGFGWQYINRQRRAREQVRCHCDNRVFRQAFEACAINAKQFDLARSAREPATA